MTIIEYLENLPEGMYLEDDIEYIEEQLRENNNEECSFDIYISVGSINVEGDTIKVTNPDNINEEALNEKVIKSLSAELEREVAFGWEGDIDNMYVAQETLNDAINIFNKLK